MAAAQHSRQMSSTENQQQQQLHSPPPTLTAHEAYQCEHAIIHQTTSNQTNKAVQEGTISGNHTRQHLPTHLVKLIHSARAALQHNNNNCHNQAGSTVKQQLQPQKNQNQQHDQRIQAQIAVVLALRNVFMHLADKGDLTVQQQQRLPQHQQRRRTPKTRTASAVPGLSESTETDQQTETLSGFLARYRTWIALRFHQTTDIFLALLNSHHQDPRVRSAAMHALMQLTQHVTTTSTAVAQQRQQQQQQQRPQSTTSKAYAKEVTANIARVLFRTHNDEHGMLLREQWIDRFVLRHNDIAEQSLRCLARLLGTSSGSATTAADKQLPSTRDTSHDANDPNGKHSHSEKDGFAADAEEETQKEEDVASTLMETSLQFLKKLGGPSLLPTRVFFKASNDSKSKQIESDTNSSGDTSGSDEDEGDDDKDVRTKDAHARCFELLCGCWIALSTKRLSQRLLLSFLSALASGVCVLDWLPSASAVQLSDFLTDAYTSGGLVGVLALDGLFALMSRHDLEYPLFFDRLYALLTAQCMRAPYRARFFALVYKFLRTGHLPAYIVAAFVKRLARLAVAGGAPPDSCLFVLTLISMLLERHAAVRVLLDRTSARIDLAAVGSDGDKDNGTGTVTATTIGEVVNGMGHDGGRVRSAAASDVMTQDVLRSLLSGRKVVDDREASGEEDDGIGGSVDGAAGALDLQRGREKKKKEKSNMAKKEKGTDGGDANSSHFSRSSVGFGVHDGFDMNEPDLTKCGALSSSLWEVHALCWHYVASVARCAKALFATATAASAVAGPGRTAVWASAHAAEADDWQKNTYVALISQEMTRRKNRHTILSTMPPSALFEQGSLLQQCFFGDESRAGGAVAGGGAAAVAGTSSCDYSDAFAFQQRQQQQRLRRKREPETKKVDTVASHSKRQKKRA